jgi:hypothetical protein
MQILNFQEVLRNADPLAGLAFAGRGASGLLKTRGLAVCA